MTRKPPFPRPFLLSATNDLAASMLLSCCVAVVVAAIGMLATVDASGQTVPPPDVVYEAEDWTGPAEAYQKDKPSDRKWNLWSTDSNAQKKWSKGVVFQSPRVLADRASTEEGAPTLHTHITGIPAGRYEVSIKLGRTLGVSRDGGKTWERKDGSNNTLGIVEIRDGTFDLWVDDRFADSASPGSGYYDSLTFKAVWPRPDKRAVTGFAAERVRERLDRGLLALPLADGRVYLGWRRLADDANQTAFNVYRRQPGKPWAKVNAEPVLATTDFVVPAGPTDPVAEYAVRTLGPNGEGEFSRPVRVQPQTDCVRIPLGEGVTVQKVGIGDLDGDGRYDYVIKTPVGNIDPAASYWKPSPDTYKLTAYSADGQRLWRHDLGWSIERGIWYSPYLVFDLDGDGRAEVIAKTGEGDPRGADGRVETGPEYVSILDGATGALLARTDWLSRQAPSEPYNYNYSSRNQMCVAYLDGKTPCLIVARGTYTVIRLEAYQFHNGKLDKLWAWDNREEGRGWRGQGAHIMHAADVDGDGRDEVIVGSCVVDDNGNGLWSTGYGHPDFCYVGDIDPAHKGLEIFFGIEPRRQEHALCLVAAGTGEVLWGLKEPTTHVGSDGMCADIDPAFAGLECHANNIDKARKFDRSWLFSAAGDLLSTDENASLSRTAYWDADLYRELVRGNRVVDGTGDARPVTLTGSFVTVADVLGDWREEIITNPPGELRIYSTTESAADRRVCLMQDPIYRIDVAVAAMGYWAAPMLSYVVSADNPAVGLRLPGLVLQAGTPRDGEVVVQAGVGKPLAGQLTLTAQPSVARLNGNGRVELAAGQAKRVPFTVSLPAASGIQEEPPTVEVRAMLDTGTGQSLAGTARFKVADTPVTGPLVVEAEGMDAQNGGEIKAIDDRTGASGKALSQWAAKGDWLEWKVNVPAGGRYRVALRYCCANGADRELCIDGDTVGRVGCPATGGFGGPSANHWAHRLFRTKARAVASLPLKAGQHTLRLTNLDARGLILDYLVLIPAQ